MKIEITTTAKEVELTNFIISTALNSIRGSVGIQEALELKDQDLDKVEAFRNKLITSLLKAAK